MRIPGSRIMLATLLFTAAVALGAGGVAVRAHQQATPAPAAITTEVLGRTEPAQAPGQALYLLRVTFAPGASVAAHTHPGATLYHVTAGALAFTLVDGSASVLRAAGGQPADATPAAEPITVGSAITLNAGDTVVYDGSAVQTERNDGGEPAVVLISNLRGADEPARVLVAGTPTP
jgi:hypothetical protein